MDERLAATLGRGIGWLLLAVLGLADARASGAQNTDPLWGLELEKGRLSWDGVALGSSLVQAEREIGVTLALEPSRDSGPCAPYVARVDHHGLSLTLGFRVPKPGAKLDWLRVRFESQQVLAGAAELAASVRAKFPDAQWSPPAEPADLVEADDLAPTYVIPGGKEPQALRLRPREALLLGAPACLE